MNILRWIDNKLTRVETVLLVTLLCLMISLAFLQVILRNFFNSGIIWLDPLLRYMVIWVLFLGAGQAASRKKHLNIDVLAKLLKGKRQKAVSLLINGLSFVVLIVLINGAIDYVITQYNNQSVLILNIKTWIFQSIVPVGLTFVAYRFFLHFIDDIAALTRRDGK